MFYQNLKLKIMKKNELEFSELQENMKVKDSMGNIGTIIKCDNEYKIVVKFKNNGGYRFYCMDPSNKIYYNPLYKYNESV